MPFLKSPGQKLLLTAISLGATFVFSPFTSAQTVTTDPVGFTKVSCLSNSDTYVAIPFTRPQTFVGAIASTAGSVLTVSGSPGWVSGRFVYAQGTQPNHYYALIGPSVTADPKEGHIYPITSNTSNTLTVDISGDSLDGIPANAQIVIIPYWTLATAFPLSDANVSFTPTTLTRTFKTEILIPDYNSTKINPPPATTYFFGNNVNNTTSNGVGWRLFGDNVTDHGDDILLPDGYFIVRNLNSAPTLPFSSIGAVLTKKVTTPELTNTTKPRDNPVCMVRPLAVPLNATGLNPADNSFVATTSTRAFKDELLVFDNSAVKINKAPSATYFYGSNVNNITSNGVGWRLYPDVATDHSNDLIAAGSALVIRKVGNGTGSPVFWTNSPTY